jgi:hypothetical protein
MTESEWLKGTDLRAMIAHISSRTTLRKARLFTAACGRHVWDLMEHPRGRHAVEFVEQLASGLAQESDRANVLNEMYAAVEGQAREDPEFWRRASYFALAAARWAVASQADHVMGGALHVATAVGRQALADAPGGEDLRAVRVAAEEEELRWQRHLIGDLFGNPFRDVSIDPGWLEWNAGTVRRLAEAAYQEREVPSGTLSPDRLAVLADALEEAGCGDAEVLGHLRRPGPHARGCWVVDLLSGRE